MAVPKEGTATRFVYDKLKAGGTVKGGDFGIKARDLHNIMIRISNTYNIPIYHVGYGKGYRVADDAYLQDRRPKLVGGFNDYNLS